MCGINGFIQFKFRKSKDEMRDMVHCMNEKITHRGPNHEGMYSDNICALGMRRLSIIDLDGGNQPIWNEDHTKLIIFNGEIYNYKTIKNDLKSRGRVFHTNADTEVVLAAFEEYGTECFKQFDGMFALAIYDTVKTEWLLARDRAGEKPLYYISNEEYFAFSSELKSLQSVGLCEKKIDRTALSIFFQLTYIPAPRTIYEGVNKLRPGTIIKLDAAGRQEITVYWELKPCGEIDKYQDFAYCKKTSG